MEGGGGAQPKYTRRTPRTVEEIFIDFEARRAAIIKALTSEVEEFSRQCDPEKENLCLYGLPSECWEVNPPVPEVPPELPEPALGINYHRDELDKLDWLGMVAGHSDAWLLSVAFFYCGRTGIDKAQRKRLFNRINDLPTVVEVVRRLEERKQGKEKSSVSNYNSNKSKSYSKKRQRGSASQAKNPIEIVVVQKKAEEEQGESRCGACRENYVAGEFWICCDFCEKWYHGSCVKITPEMAENIAQYKCPLCINKKQGL